MRGIAALLQLILLALSLWQSRPMGQNLGSFVGKRTIAGGETYKSPHHVFTVMLPQPTAFERMPYSVHADTKKGEYETVTFLIVDFGEMYRAGALLNSVGVNVNDVADNAAITEKHQLAHPPQLIEETKIDTQFGEGSLRMYFAENGSRLQSGDLSKLKTSDSYIAVIVVRQGTRLYFAAAQDDNIGDVEKYGQEQWKQKLKESVGQFFATMVANQ